MLNFGGGGGGGVDTRIRVGAVVGGGDFDASVVMLSLLLVTLSASTYHHCLWHTVGMHVGNTRTICLGPFSRR